MSEQDFEFLRKSPLTANLDDGEVRVLAEICVCRDLADEEVLFEEGKTDEQLYVITSGRLAVTRETGGGDWTTLHILKEGDLAGEMGFVDGRPHSATLRALGATTVCSLSREDFEGLVTRHPWVVYRTMQAIVTAVHDILRRMNAQYVEMNNYITKQHGRY
jgi:CRP-like cAMP-binding protein